MAAGRGQFISSFMRGLERQREPLAPGRPPQGCARGKPGPGGGQAGGRRKNRRPEAARRPVSGSELRCAEPTTEENKIHFPEIKTCFSRKNFVERLPSEILIKILSYLDASSLFCIGHVSKLFHRLANDDVMWHKIYTSEFGSQTWRPKAAEGGADAAVKEDPAEAKDRLSVRWKKMYLWTMAGQEMDKWRRELRDISPYTGLPRQTEWVLRKLNVSWELTVCDRRGRQSTLEPSRVYFFESSMIVRWSGGDLPICHHISSIQLHGVRKEAPRSPKARKPSWRSLILKRDVKSHLYRFVGKDRLIKLLHLTPGFVVGVWRGQGSVAFIMLSLHFHKLVERSLLGSPLCPYSEPVDLPPADKLDHASGLHDYTVHFVLHNTGAEIMSGHYRLLSIQKVQTRRGVVELKVIDRTDLSQHRPLSGSIKLPWKSEALEGSVENCCIMTLTLLDDFQKPFWCVSSPVSITMAEKTLSFEYGGDHFLMNYQDPGGEVKMKLVWLKEQRQFFLISLTVYVAVSKVGKRFGREV